MIVPHGAVCALHGEHDAVFRQPRREHAAARGWQDQGLPALAAVARQPQLRSLARVLGKAQDAQPVRDKERAADGAVRLAGAEKLPARPAVGGHIYLKHGGIVRYEKPAVLRASEAQKTAGGVLHDRLYEALGPALRLRALACAHHDAVCVHIGEGVHRAGEEVACALPLLIAQKCEMRALAAAPAERDSTALGIVHDLAAAAPVLCRPAGAREGRAVGYVSLRRTRGLLLTGGGEGAGGAEQAQRRRQQCRDDELPASPRDGAYPLPQLPPARAYWAARAQQLGGPGLRREEDERLAVGAPLALAEPCEHGLVAGQLAVRPRERRREPHQRVPPVHDETGRPQNRPDMVEVPVMAVLVLEHIPEVLPVTGAEIYCGPEQPKQAGRRDSAALEDPQPGLRLPGGPARPAQPQIKAQVDAREQQ